MYLTDNESACSLGVWVLGVSGLWGVWDFGVWALGCMDLWVCLAYSIIIEELTMSSVNTKCLPPGIHCICTCVACIP